MIFVDKKFVGFQTENELLLYADLIEDSDGYTTNTVAVIFKGPDAESPNPKRLEYDIRFRPGFFGTSSLFSYTSSYVPEDGE